MDNKMKKQLNDIILSKSNIANIMNDVIKKNKLSNMDADDKRFISKLTVDNLTNLQKSVKFDKLTKENFNAVVTKINSKCLTIVNEKVKQAIINSFDPAGENTKFDDSDESLGDRIKREEEMRNQEIRKGLREKPPTPDFSLEPKSKKQREAERRRKEEEKKSKALMKKDDTHDTMDDQFKPFNRINDDEGNLDHIYNNASSMHGYDFEFDPIDDSNLNNYTLNVNKRNRYYDDAVPISQKVSEYETERNNDLNKNNKNINNTMSGNNQNPHNYVHYQQQPVPYRQSVVRRPVPYYPQQQPYQQPYQQPLQPLQQYGHSQYHQPPQQYGHPHYQQPLQQPQYQQPLQQPLQQPQYQQPLQPSTIDNETLIQNLNTELDQKTMEIQALADKLKKMMSENKSDKIQEKKAELIKISENCRIDMETNKKLKDETDQLLKQFNTMKQEFLSTIQNNLTSYNSLEKSEIVVLNNCSEESNFNFTHELSEPCDELTMIEVNSYSFPEYVYNINMTNNTLYFSIEADYEYSDVPNVRHTYQNNVHVFQFAPNYYTLDNLISLLSEVFEQFNINVGHDDGIVSFNNTENVKFAFYDKLERGSKKNSELKNNMIGLFNLSDGAINNPHTMFYSVKAVSLKSDKIINVYIKNISTTTPIFKVNVSTKKLYNHVIRLNKALKNITHFELEFRDSSNQIVYFNKENSFIELTLKTIQKTIKTVNVTNENNTTSPEDFYDQLVKTFA